MRFEGRFEVKYRPSHPQDAPFSQTLTKYPQSKTTCFGTEKAVFSEGLDGLLLTKTTCFTFPHSILSISHLATFAVQERLLHHEVPFWYLAM